MGPGGVLKVVPVPDVTLPSAPELPGASPLHSGKVRDLYELDGGAARGPAADGGQRPDLDLRLRARHHHPRQGRDPHPDVAVVVRPARRPGAQPRRLDRRARAGARPRGGLRAARDVSRSSAWPAATSPAPGCSTTARPARSAGSRCRTGSRTAAGCPSRSSRRPPRPTLGDHDENVVVRRGGRDRRRRARRRAARAHPRRSTRGPRGSPASAASSWPTPSSSSARRADGTTVLADEVLTPDSSRFWPAAEWQPGRAQPSYDKQIVRNWLLSPGVRLGPRRRRAAAAAAGRGRRAHPGAVRRGLRAAHRRARSDAPARRSRRVRRRPRGGLRLPRRPAPPTRVAVVAQAGLGGRRRAAGRPDLDRRDEARTASRRCAPPSSTARRGGASPAPGAFVRAELTLDFAETATGCEVSYEFRIHALGPLGAVASWMSGPAVGADLTRAAGLLGARG